MTIPKPTRREFLAAGGAASLGAPLVPGGVPAGGAAPPDRPRTLQPTSADLGSLFPDLALRRWHAHAGFRLPPIQLGRLDLDLRRFEQTLD